MYSQGDASRVHVWATHRQLACVLAAGEWFGSDWVPTDDCTKERLPFLAKVATFLSIIAGCHLAEDRAACGKDVSSPISWETPSQSEWATIVKTCHLVLLALTWLLDPAKTEPFMHGKDAHIHRLQLEKGLWGILHGMLIGHMQNHDLPLDNVPQYMLEAATHALGRKAMASYQPLVELLRALLIRLAQDTKLAEDTGGETHQYEQLQLHLLGTLWGFMGMPAAYHSVVSTWCLMCYCHG